jgi:hypothetical protein
VEVRVDHVRPTDGVPFQGLEVDVWSTAVLALDVTDAETHLPTPVRRYVSTGSWRLFRITVAEEPLCSPVAIVKLVWPAISAPWSQVIVRRKRLAMRCH